MNTPRTTKKIDPNAYYALTEALSVIFWYKDPFERFLRAALRDSPELLVGLTFTDPKRAIAGRLIDRLMANEAKYQPVTISLMLIVARMDRFPDLERQEDRDAKLAQAHAAIAELRKWTERHQAIIDQNEQRAAELAKAAESASQTRAFSDAVADLRQEFFALHANPDPPGKRQGIRGIPQPAVSTIRS